MRRILNILVFAFVLSCAQTAFAQSPGKKRKVGPDGQPRRAGKGKKARRRAGKKKLSVAQRFKRRDKNNDGRITPDETKNGQAGKAFRRRDLNNDGAVTLEELRQFHAQRKAQKGQGKGRKGKGKRKGKRKQAPSDAPNGSGSPNNS